MFEKLSSIHEKLSQYFEGRRSKSLHRMRHQRFEELQQYTVRGRVRDMDIPGLYSGTTKADEVMEGMLEPIVSGIAFTHVRKFTHELPATTITIDNVYFDKGAREVVEAMPLHQLEDMFMSEAEKSGFVWEKVFKPKEGR
jgi:hypothetical protein